MEQTERQIKHKNSNWEKKRREEKKINSHPKYVHILELTKFVYYKSAWKKATVLIESTRWTIHSKEFGNCKATTRCDVYRLLQAPTKLAKKRTAAAAAATTEEEEDRTIEVIRTNRLKESESIEVDFACNIVFFSFC